MMTRRMVVWAALCAVAFAAFAEGPRVARRKPLTANVGVVSVGLDTYWKQCPGLLEDMVKKEGVFAEKLAAHQVKVTRFGMSDNPQKAHALIPAMKAADLDLLFVDMVTYATSSTFAPFVRELNVPIVLVALQPDARLDYERATIYKQLYNDDLCSVPEFTGVAIRYGRPVADVVIGLRTGDAKADEEIRQWCAVAHVLHDLRRARIGLMGHVLEAMYDMQVDPTAVSRTFGCHVALCEPDEILPFYRNPDAAAVEAMKARILGFFDTPDPVSDPWTEKLTAHDLDVAAKAAVALEAFIDKRALDGPPETTLPLKSGRRPEKLAFTSFFSMGLARYRFAPAIRKSVSSSVICGSKGACPCSRSVVPISTFPFQGIQKSTRPSAVFGMSIADFAGINSRPTTMCEPREIRTRLSTSGSASRRMLSTQGPVQLKKTRPLT